MQTIQVGDKARVKEGTDNEGLGMEVLEIDGNKALCEWAMDSSGGAMQQWYDLENLIFVSRPEAGFI